MKIEQIIIDAVMLTEKTGIPVLLLSNPGLGKTTILKRFAQKNNYHLETLIGSRFSPEEISGYQVNNGGDHLTHLAPEWYSRIMKKSSEGIKTLLFIDEISTCSEAVQGSLLSLIFDRTIGSEKYLPEDCIIVSAANYSQNLPSVMNIMAPTLNRFILINLNEDYNCMDLLEEFIEDPEENFNSYKAPSKLPENYDEIFKKNFKTAWKEIFLKYSDPNAALGYLDISNRQLDGIYCDEESFIYNFISGRTISYLSKTLLAYSKLGMKNDDLLKKIVYGLVGNGTNTFTSKKQKDNFKTFVLKMMKTVLSKKQEKPAEFILLQNDIIKDVQAFLINSENTSFYEKETLAQIILILEEIKTTFAPEKIFEALKDKSYAPIFTAQMEAIIELQQFISQYPDSSNLTYEISRIAMDYYGIYCDIMKTKPDFKETFGCENPLFEKVLYLTKKESSKKNYFRSVIRKKVKGEYQRVYKLDEGMSFTDGNLKQLIHTSERVNVLFWNDGLQSVSLDEYIKFYSRAAS